MSIDSILTDPVAVITVILGILGTASGWIATHLTKIKLVVEKAKNKDLAGTISGIIDLMSSDVPQDEAQTALIENGTVPGKTWKMSDANKTQLFNDLRNSGGEVRKEDLLAVIAKAEAESQVEYAILLVDHKGEPDRTIINPLSDTQKDPCQQHEVYHGFVSYGIPSVQTYEETIAKAKDTSSKQYTLEEYWYMTDAEKATLMSNIGYSNPKCINEAQAIINEAEEKQWESYYVACGNHTFLVVKGNVTQVGANPKTDAPKETT